MTEKEARDALFKLHEEYMLHTPDERLNLYDEYKQKRAEIRKQLATFISERIKSENNNIDNINESNKIR